MSPTLNSHHSANVTKTVLSPKHICPQIVNVTEIKIFPKHNCHQNANVIKMQMSLKHKMSPTWKCPITQMSPKVKYHKNWSLPIGSGTTRSPGLIHISPRHGLSDSRLVFVLYPLFCPEKFYFFSRYYLGHWLTVIPTVVSLVCMSHSSLQACMIFHTTQEGSRNLIYMVKKVKLMTRIAISEN